MRNRQKVSKVCPICGLDTYLRGFGKDKNKKDGIRSHCKFCENKRVSLYQKTPAGKAHNAKKMAQRRLLNKTTLCNLTLAQWNKILKMQGNLCAQCKREFTTKLQPTRDHIIPVSKGGGLTFGNEQAHCHSCNSKKQNRIDFMRGIYELIEVTA